MGLSPEISVQLQPLVITSGGKSRRRNWVIFKPKSFPACPGGLLWPSPAFYTALQLLGCFQSPTCLRVQGGGELGNVGIDSVPSPECFPCCSSRPPCLSRSTSSCLSTKHTSSTRQPDTCHHLSMFFLFKPVPMVRPVVSTRDPQECWGGGGGTLSSWARFHSACRKHYPGENWLAWFILSALLLRSAEPRAAGWHQGQHTEAAAFETLFAQLLLMEELLGKLASYLSVKVGMDGCLPSESC